MLSSPLCGIFIWTISYCVMVFKYCSAWRLSWKLKVYIPPSNHNPPPHFSEYSRLCKSNIWYVDYSKARMNPYYPPSTNPMTHINPKGRNHSLSIKGVQESRKNLGLGLDFETNTSLGLSLDLEIWQKKSRSQSRSRDFTKKVSIPVSISRFYK